MSDLRKAAEAALEALEIASRNGSDGLKRYELKELDDAITALRAALAQPERKPLTPEEIYKLFGWYAVPFVRAVEKAHGIGGKE